MAEACYVNTHEQFLHHLLQGNATTRVSCIKNNTSNISKIKF